MESLGDQFSCEDLQDDDEHEKLKDTISSILNSSLEEGETLNDNTSEPSEKLDGADLPGGEAEVNDGKTPEVNDGKTLTCDVDESTNKEVPENDRGTDLVSTVNDSEETSSLSPGRTSRKKTSPVNQLREQMTDDEMETDRNISPTEKDVRSPVTDNYSTYEKDAPTSVEDVTTQAEENIPITEKDLPIAVHEQKEHIDKVMNSAVIEEKITSTTEEKQLTPQKRGRALVETEEYNSSKTCMSEVDDPSPIKRQKKTPIQSVPSNSIESKLAKSPNPKKRGRPSKKFDDLGERSEELDNRKSLRAPTKTVQYNEAFSSPEKEEEDIVTKDDVPKMLKKHSMRAAKEKAPIVRLKYKSGETGDSFFLPEGWCFYAKKRYQPTPNRNKTLCREQFDMYYLTPLPQRRKVRSRQELASVCKLLGLKMDPTKFFIRQQIKPFVKKGILTFYDEHTVILPSNLEVIDYLPKQLPRKMKSDQPNQTIKTEETIVSTPPLKKEITQPKEVSKNLTVDSRKKLSRKSSFSPKTKASSPKTEPLSPPGQVQSQDLPPVITKEHSAGIVSVSDPPKKKPGRPRKKVVLEPEVTTQPKLSEEESIVAEEKPIEEKVRIRSKPPRKSPYFSSSLNGSEQSRSLAGLRRERKGCDAPPRSPYNLIQEDLFHDPWQMLIATIFLNATSGKIAIPLALEFLKRWPTPQLARQAKVDDILDLIEPLGFGRTRAAIILRFSHEFLTKDWRLPNELYGIGDYGNDSYKIFCMKNEWKNVRSDDPMLMMYLNWRRATEHLRKKFLKSTDTSVATDFVDSSGSSQKVLRPRAPTPSPVKRRTRTK